MATIVSVPGKIILSGEYGGRILGHPSIVVPAPFRLTASFIEGSFGVEWPEIEGRSDWTAYIRDILLLLAKKSGQKPKRIHIENQIPLGKGMGSSTALVIALSRLFLSENCHDDALAIEDKVNPGHSGMDFAVIWRAAPIHFSVEKGAEPIKLDEKLLQGALLIDTGAPNETTPELVAWVKSRKDELHEASEQIARCTQRITEFVRLSGVEARQILPEVIHDHHRAQCALGIVPESVKALIARIEAAGGAAKVIGAGGRSGGAGMVLALGIGENLIKEMNLPYRRLS
ncbi:MAG TPA: hypothetical protein VI913_04875 [Candidatus Peribacteraceae bacterium]|nr:hypothetical protein [Candidatus Peribacteraceae bacterium]